VKSKIWIAISIHLLFAINKEHRKLNVSPYNVLQTLQVTLFDKMRLQRAFPGNGHKILDGVASNQLNIFLFYPATSDRRWIASSVHQLPP